MELQILNAAESWDSWSLAYPIQMSEKFRTVASKCLWGFISDSQVLGGILLDQFWIAVEACGKRCNPSDYTLFLDPALRAYYFKG
ncbi:hypothetical protein APHAL10511_005629 [Amanita phalloides]|nr:hypothetical protein APHAL10511_005629 [Amanita phalloides]